MDEKIINSILDIDNQAKANIAEIEKQNNRLNNITKDQKTIGFGSGKRSYIMCPYTLVKDNDSNYETPDVNKVLDGNIEEFIKEGVKYNGTI